jgi:phosphatidylglycerophosphatase C
MKPSLALFDFDGTLTRKDTLFEFVIFVHGKSTFYRMMISILPWIVLMKLNLASAQSVKERLLRKSIGGLPNEKFSRFCEEFCTRILPQLFRETAHEKLIFHHQQGDKIVIVSASPEDWIAPWARTKAIEVLSTKLKRESGRISGEIDGLNCNGPEKVRRVKTHLNLAEYNKVYAYGDSTGDRELLSLADYPFYRKFN